MQPNSSILNSSQQFLGASILGGLSYHQIISNNESKGALVIDSMMLKSSENQNYTQYSGKNSVMNTS